MVLDSRYNSTVPLLLGTNILAHFLTLIREKNGCRFLQVANLMHSTEGESAAQEQESSGIGQECAARKYCQAKLHSDSDRCGRQALGL